MERKFEKVSFKQYSIDVNNNIDDYNAYTLPKRSTKYSAGYDFVALTDIIIKPGETVKNPTGIKAAMYDDEVLLVVIRSSMGYKHNIVLPNQMGVIDCDYYNNRSNEGHIFIPLRNLGIEDMHIKKGDKVGQGIFTKFLTVDNEDEINTTREGGIGSTNKGDAIHE